jgi:hypothetical protein
MLATERGSPVEMKSLLVRNGRWKSSTTIAEFTLGKEEKGRAMAADTTNHRIGTQHIRD